ncbi:SH3 domain-containing kinase-binding protein 1 [Orchesella cincta]|uniref:SH3 domain-containing kinase-binding protein 1 n=1 Tax=Orchesella cincta TaxID=48709 RepID=A0A1D2N5U5_ORCCI|nr:SH3 domain-containing kinase-binding protein 1 [Orchesella cincta]
MECRVEFDYVAQEPDELTIKKGEIIKNVVSKMDGWFEGTLRGKTGVFPDNFVKLVEKPIPEPLEKSGKPSEVVVLRNNPNSARRVRVLFSYSPEQEDELALDVGDVLEFIEEVEEGWWRGRLKGKEGIFPSNFVSEVEAPKTNGSIDVKKPDDTKQKDVSRASHPKGIPDVVPSSPNQSIDDEPAPELPPKPVRELARCFYPYKALNEDELSLAEGDIVTIISKQCEDEGWWRGELRGKIGMFPDNFVRIITPGEVHPAVGSGGPQPKILAQERNVPHLSAELLPAKAKKDSIAGISGGTVVDGVGLSKSVEKDKSGESKVEQVKAKLNKTNSKEPQQVPKVGHVATSPISPGIAAFHTNLFSNQKPEPLAKRDSSSASRDDRGSDDAEEFNSVERTETLNHLTATRAKAPKRRPPSTIITRENDVSMMNGSSHSFDNSVADSPPPHHSTPMNISVTSNGGTPSVSYTEQSSLNHSGSFHSHSRDKEGSPTPSSANSSIGAAKPKKQALPWMAELKQTQDRKKNLVSPIAPSAATTTPGSTSLSTTPPVTTSPALQQQQPAPVHPVTPKEPAAKAPPLPAKPSSLAPSTGQEKVVNNVNHTTTAPVNNTSFGGSNKPYPKKSHSPAPPAPIVTSNHTSNSVSNSSDSHRGDGDSNSNKGYVTYEEYSALKTRVTSLENEVETLKRQIKLLLDRDLRGHIV